MLLFFNIGSGELILILLILFVVLGPKRMPEVARTVGKAINEMKRASAGFKNEIDKEVQKIERETKLTEFIQERRDTNPETVEQIEQAVERAEQTEDGSTEAGTDDIQQDTYTEQDNEPDNESNPESNKSEG